MKVVIGGANGLVGKELVQALVARGDEVVALARKPAQAEWTRGARLVLWDGKTQGDWSREVDGADALVNMAGLNVGDQRWDPEFKRRILASRLDSTGACVEALRAATKRPRVFLSASAVGYYGSQGDTRLDESGAPGKDFLATVCQQWEAAAEPAAALGVRTIQLRTGVVLAPDGGALAKMLPPFKAFVGGPLGDGKQWFPWIHLADEIALCLFLLDHATLAGPVNAAAPGIVNMNDFAKALGKVLHRPSIARVPALAVRLAVGEFADAVLASQRVIPEKLQAAGFAFKFPEVEGALRELLG